MAKYYYPAVFKKEDKGLSVIFPDLESCYTQGKDIDDAYEMASDVLCLTLYRMEVGIIVLLMDTTVLSCMAVTVGSYGNIGSIVVMYLAVVEASVRFGLKGSLVMDIISAIFIAGIWKYGAQEWGFTYTIQDYLVYVGIMCFISLMVGMVSRNAKHQRRTAEKLVRDRALIEERHRMSNELHDGVLKSLQGLSLEAYALSKDAPDDIKEKTLYFAEV